MRENPLTPEELLDRLIEEILAADEDFSFRADVMHPNIIPTEAIRFDASTEDGEGNTMDIIKEIIVGVDLHKDVETETVGITLHFHRASTKFRFNYRFGSLSNAQIIRSSGEIVQYDLLQISNDRLLQALATNMKDILFELQDNKEGHVEAGAIGDENGETVSLNSELGRFAAARLRVLLSSRHLARKDFTRYRFTIAQDQKGMPFVVSANEGFAKIPVRGLSIIRRSYGYTIAIIRDGRPIEGTNECNPYVYQYEIDDDGNIFSLTESMIPDDKEPEPETSFAREVKLKLLYKVIEYINTGKQY